MPRRTSAPPPFGTLTDLPEAARARLTDAVWGYVQGAAGAERTARANEAAFDRWTLLPQPLAALRSVALGTKLLGTAVRAPFFVAPTAYQREVHPDGERATAAAAASVGVLMVASTLSSNPLEAIARASGDGPRWFQLYLQPSFDASLALVRRAEQAGYAAIVLTVDAPVLGSRDQQARTGFALDALPPIGNGPGVRPPPRGPGWTGGTYDLGDAADVSWSALERLVQATELPVVVKGLLSADGARRAVDLGARGIYVSNHGGRQLDRSPATLDVLAEVAEAVGRRAEVYVDGGVRRGSDVAIALALGARAVGLGRPVLWALAAGGRSAVERYLQLLGAELGNSLLLLGCPEVARLDRQAVVPAPSSRSRPTRSPHDARGTRPRRL
jgi:isopentenyl diphosphate isomerase/L-lactate dehydrogenase-like FMN-dependent dehydrogenase